MNKKGFMMAELVVVSSIIVISLTALYLSYNKLITSYRQIVNYYDVGFLYKLGYYNHVLFNEEMLDTVLNEVESSGYINLNDKITLETDENIYIAKNKSAIVNLKNQVENQTFKEYITYLLDAKKLDSENYIIGEQCQSNNKCIYAYMEVANEQAE